MARNKHPEETVNLILDTAFRLFMEKGYEYTSIQDIIDNLGGLSKGAIYHHFKSKEDMLIAVTDRMTADSNKILADIRDNPGISGKEKLKTIYKTSVNRSVNNDIFSVCPNFKNNSKLLFSLLHEIVREAAPDYIAPIIKQGISDDQDDAGDDGNHRAAHHDPRGTELPEGEADLRLEAACQQTGLGRTHERAQGRSALQFRTGQLQRRISDYQRHQ